MRNSVLGSRFGAGHRAPGTEFWGLDLMAHRLDPGIILRVRRVLLALVLAASGSAARAEVSIMAPPFGSVRAGETARVAWQGLPADVEELELLLSVEGLPDPVRVTPELSPRSGQLLWRVPNLPTRRARITIRFGLEAEEVESAPSAPFEILPARGEAPAVLDFRRGEWWAQDAGEARWPGALSSLGGKDRIGEARECPTCGGVPQTTPTTTRKAARAAGGRNAEAASFRTRPALPRRPIEVPARI